MKRAVQSHPKWNSPRTTIACQYKANDFAYAEHGIFSAMQVYKLFNISPSQAAEMTVLDYGCGTGRQARALSSLFKKVVAYDPTPGCITEFHKEIKLTERTFPNIQITSNFDDVPECDIAYSVAVIEHLDHVQQEIMIENLRDKVKGSVVLAYHAIKNAEVVAPFLTAAEIEDDKVRAEKEKRVIRMKSLVLRK